MEHREQMDVMNLDEMINGLFYAGEAHFHRGEFKEALYYLLRCIRAPKSGEVKVFEAKSYRLLGMIYGYLGQELLAKEDLLKALDMSEEAGQEKEVIKCYMSLGFLHEKLTDFEQALAYFTKALQMINRQEDESDIKVTCLACCGVTSAELGQLMQAEEYLKQIEHTTGETCEKSLRIPVLDLALRVSYEKGDISTFEKCFKQLLGYSIIEEGFFETFEVYFDVCTFLFKNKLQKEVRSLLDYLKSYLDKLPLAYLKYHIYNFELSYAKSYGEEDTYWEATQNLLAFLPEHEAEQQGAKLYSFDYIEYLHEERELSAKMEQKSKLDPMTGLFNKFTIEFLVDEYFSQMGREGASALILIDMDHFKEINDTLGHLAGDAIICDTAAVMRRFFKDDALCGRVGGDEFAIFVKDARDISSLLLQAEFLRQEIAKITTERNLPIASQASMGIAVSTAGCHDYAGIFSAADEALYRAKKEGRNKICVIE